MHPPSQKPLDTSPRKLQSFEFGSPLWWRKSGIWIVCIFAVVAFLMMNAPRTTGWSKRPDQTEAVSNARQIGLALSEFDQEYGKYPGETTIAKVREKTGSGLDLGTKSSNDFFRQLLAADIVQGELMFYAKIRGTKQPDDVFRGKDALKKGEVGFAYLSGLSSAGDPTRPIAVTPLIPGTDRFDPKPFDGRAVILKMDNSVTVMHINKDGHVMEGRRNLLDPGHPIWGGEKWTLVWPDL
ncbi:MAG: hypothetical protein V4584_15150 [Verrucomicrobiota bacterium]